MSETSRGPRVTRESRLLLATVAVCALALVVLARIRFPERPPTAEAAAQPPLERLAARATYDALAADIQRVEPMIAQRVMALRVAGRLSTAPRTISDALAGNAGLSPLQHVAALRIAADAAVAVMPAGARVDGIVGDTVETDVSETAVDAVRHLARIRVPNAAVREMRQVALAALPTPAYVAAVEATQAGVTIRPVFIGRSNPFSSSRWSRPLLPLGGIAVAPGALMFTLDGDFIGIVVMENGSPMVVGAQDLLDTAARLAEGGSHPADPGLALQRLTPQLQAALGAEHGVVVAEVSADSPVAGVLAPPDVIVSVDGWSTDDPDQLLLRLGTSTGATLSIVRDGKSDSVTIGSIAGSARGQSTAQQTPAMFALERGIGSRVIERNGSAPPPGLMTGDLIVRAGAFAAPTPAQVQQVLGAARGFAVFVVRRQDAQRVVAVPVTGRSTDVR